MRLCVQSKSGSPKLTLLNWHLAGFRQTRHGSGMKTASVQQVPQKWTQILEWVAAGEEVEVTEREKVIARVVPVTQPDFLARAKAIWGEQPPGKPLSELVVDARGGES
jgi:antitoxin (DNA-binding transcriptional repressor) of toxin-antitoxin stability system